MHGKRGPCRADAAERMARAPPDTGSNTTASAGAVPRGHAVGSTVGWRVRSRLAAGRHRPYGDGTSSRAGQKPPASARGGAIPAPAPVRRAAADSRAIAATRPASNRVSMLQDSSPAGSQPRAGQLEPDGPLAVVTAASRRAPGLAAAIAMRPGSPGRARPAVPPAPARGPRRPATAGSRWLARPGRTSTLPDPTSIAPMAFAIVRVGQEFGCLPARPRRFLPR